MLKTPGASYKAIIVPDVQYISVESLAKLLQLAKDGATVIFADRLPDDVPGLYELEARRAKLHADWFCENHTFFGCRSREITQGDGDTSPHKKFTKSSQFRDFFI